MNRQRRVRLLVPFLTLGGLTLAAAAQTNLPVSVMSTVIIVTASRTEKDIQSVPATAYRVDAQARAHEEGARTTPDLLQGLPSTLLQQTSQGQSSPYLRGFTGFRTLALIDGVRLNNSVFRDGPNQYWGTVDPWSLQAAELVMGPASVLYGSDAIGGSLNALSLAPSDWTGAPSFETTLFTRGSSADNSLAGRLQADARLSEKVGFVGGYTVRDYDDLYGGHKVGRQSHTGYEEQSYDARLDVAPDPDSLITLLRQSYDQDDAWRTHKTIYGIDWEGLSVGDEKRHVFDQHRDLTSLDYQHENLGGFVDRVKGTLSRQVQSEDRDRIKADDTRDVQGFDVATYGSSLQLESDTASGNWIYGFDYYLDRVESYTDKYKATGAFDKSDIQGPVGDNANYETIGLFAEDTIRLLDGGLDVIPGLRYTRSRADADQVKDPETGKSIGMTGDWDDLCGSLRLLRPLTPDRRHVLFGGVSQGFRAPNLSDLTRLDTARSNEIETPVEDLDPEHFTAYEVGLKSRVARFTSQLSFYYTVIDGMIVRAPTGRTVDGYSEVTKKNSGDGYIQGAEWSGSVALDREWTAWLNASWMHGRVDAYPTSDAVRERDYVSRLMPPTAQTGLRWRREDGKYWGEGAIDMADKADHLSADDERDTQRIPPGGTPGYLVYSLRAGTKLTQRLSLSTAVENLFDEDYRIHGSGVNEAGRNVIVEASCRF